MSETQNLINAFGSNYGYIEDVYKLYLENPDFVSAEWQKFFNDFENNLISPQVALGANGNSKNGHNYQARIISEVDKIQKEDYKKIDTNEDLRLQERVYRLVYSYRNYGHLSADINPLKSAPTKRPQIDRLSPSSYNFTKEQLESDVYCYKFQNKERCKLNNLINDLQEVYSATIGFEYQHILNQFERHWLRDKIENRKSKGFKIGKEEKIRGLQKIIDAEIFESELHLKYLGQKRFSLEGGETLIPMVVQILEEACRYEHKEVILGMAHRGRLNILRNIMGKPLQEIFYEFEDKALYSVLGSGDVKYHLGFKSKYINSKNQEVELVLCPNPSHLEFVYPVTIGIVKAKQDLKFQQGTSSVLPLIFHGDSAFVGQGIVAETLNFANIEGYSTGGVVHIVINNQIGFTTTPDEYATSVYCTDFAKAIEAPILHINAEDVEACIWAANLAVEYRNTFHKDIILDLYCYRKYGHNEGDDPSYTQPLIYEEIKNKEKISSIYARKLKSENIISSDDIESYIKSLKDDFTREHSQTRPPQVLGEACSMHGKLRIQSIDTRVSFNRLLEVAETTVTYPPSVTPNSKVKGILEKRVETIKNDTGIDWGTAETLAYGTLLQDGIDVRISGEDSGRGTFSHRMILINDAKTAEHYMTLQPLVNKYKSLFNIYNSPLSEAGILGFEFGYSTIATDPLVIWEAQFGDFANGAQVIIDQFISSSEQKWHQLSGLVMLLPHGFEGQGPEHSSARLERFLQLCADGNMRVAYPTTASQCFHLLRDQALSKLKRPLVIMSPKSLLRSQDAMCKLKDLTDGGLEPLLVNDFGVTADNIKETKIVITAGKVFYDIEKALKNIKNCNVRVIRLELLYPFPQFEAKKALRGIDTNTAVWVQEEPLNMGAWLYIEPYLRTKLGLKIEYAGRETSASPATGSPKRHNMEQEILINQMLKFLDL